MRLRLLMLSLAVLYPQIALSQVPGLSPSSPWALDGYVKYLASAQSPEHGEHALDQLVHQRLNLEYRFSAQLRVNIGMRNRLFVGDALALPGYAEQVERDRGYAKLSRNWIASDNAVLNSQFDRAYVHWERGEMQYRLGRFRVNWSMATLWNPNDIFNAYSIYDFDYEERAGSDAVQISRQVDFASSLDLVVSPTRDSDETSAAVRYLGNHHGWDWQTMVGKASRDSMVGAAMAGDILGAGVRSEVSYFEPIASLNTEREANSSIIATIESDYSIASRRNWLIRAALLYISNPQPAEDNGATLISSARTLSFATWTTYIDAGFDFNELSRLNTSLVYYDDGSWFAGVTAAYSLADNWIASAVVQHFDGRASSVFGQSANTTLNLQLKWNF
ncbi:hypothetical protein [Thaumasiovibrio sp. DFM-14]|uniref:hypothetical protein n=1 Tax=Thaumasiovibrio sp. DFM-14 TaxID=3384792 RepID=UPI00399F137C